MPRSLSPPRRPVRVVLACAGLEHAARGFESFARECFAALVSEEGLEMTLVKGSGPSGQRERSVATLTRASPVARGLSRVARREPFRVEQVAFAFSLQAELARLRPDVVYFSEWHTGLALAWLRRLLRATFRLAYCNGAMAVEGFGHLDLVQQLTPAALETVLSHGADPARQCLLPLGFSIHADRRPVTEYERAGLRARLGLPQDRRVVLSVAALNRSHKRLDYVIEEVARLPEPRPYLLLVGQPEPETPAIRTLAERLLGPDGHSIRTVPAADVPSFYRAGDVLVLASLGEAFGRVLIEAMAEGVPCVAHDYAVTRYVLGGHGRLGELSRPGRLADLLHSIGPPDMEEADRRHRFAYERFSWDRLRSAYVAFLRAAAGLANNTVSSSSGEAVRTKQR